MRLVRRFLGRTGYFGTTMGAMAGEYGLDGATLSRVLVVNEVYEMESWGGAKVAGNLKTISGGDEVSANIKYVKQRRLMMGAVPVLVSNELPKLPDHGKGMSNRLVVLQFNRRFRGTGEECLNLDDRLWREREFIFKWAMEGLSRLLRGEQWVIPESGREAIATYASIVSPVTAYLEERCNRDPKGFVKGTELVESWRKWCTDRGVQPPFGDNMLISQLIVQGGWNLKRHRAARGGARGLKGMLFRRYEGDGLGAKTTWHPENPDDSE